LSQISSSETSNKTNHLSKYPELLIINLVLFLSIVLSQLQATPAALRLCHIGIAYRYQLKPLVSFTPGTTPF
jgi:hypothetical protein